MNSALFLHNGTTYRVSLEVITADEARSYLERNVRNRKFAESQLQKISEALKGGDWCFNGASIVFDREGNLADGQHRLIACARTGVPLTTLVVRGVVPMVAQDTTDNTRRRTLASQLQIRGEKNYKTLAGTIGVYYQLVRSNSVGISSGVMPSIVQGLRVLEEHPGLRGSTRLALKTKERPLRYPGGLCGGLHYRFSELAPDDADVFWTRFLEGQGLVEGDPILTLRERMIAEAARGAGKPSMTMKYRAAVTIKAWNAWLAGEQLKQLKWRPGGANPEAFPQIASAASGGDA